MQKLAKVVEKKAQNEEEFCKAVLELQELQEQQQKVCRKSEKQAWKDKEEAKAQAKLREQQIHVKTIALIVVEREAAWKKWAARFNIPYWRQPLPDETLNVPSLQLGEIQTIEEILEAANIHTDVASLPFWDVTTADQQLACSLKCQVLAIIIAYLLFQGGMEVLMSVSNCFVFKCYDVWKKQFPGAKHAMFAALLLTVNRVMPGLATSFHLTDIYWKRQRFYICYWWKGLETRARVPII